MRMCASVYVVYEYYQEQQAKEVYRVEDGREEEQVMDGGSSDRGCKLVRT